MVSWSDRTKLGVYSKVCGNGAFHVILEASGSVVEALQETLCMFGLSNNQLPGSDFDTMTNLSPLRIGITIGDINGIGPEVIMKTLSNDYIRRQCTPVIYGSGKILSFHRAFSTSDPFVFQQINTPEQAANGQISVINCWQDQVEVQLGQPTAEAGKCAIAALERAVADLKNGKIDALVTAPVHKQAMTMAGFGDIGHTGYLARQFPGREALMMMASDQLRVAVVTDHIPLAEVATHLTIEAICRKADILERSLRVDFGIERPVISILGLNPHAGDGGLIGKEDETIVKPAIMKCKQAGIMVTGPHPADGFFGSGTYQKVDAVLAMYHDQGLTPYKTIRQGGGVNFTAGLPVVRTSPDHGVAFDIAGKGMADNASFRKALFMAVDIIRSRREHAEWHANPLQTKDTFRKGEDEQIME